MFTVTKSKIKITNQLLYTYVYIEKKEKVILLLPCDLPVRIALHLLQFIKNSFKIAIVLQNQIDQKYQLL